VWQRLFRPEAFTLLVDATGATLWHRRWLPEGAPAGSPTHATALAHVLLKHARVAVRVVADDAAQDIVLDWLPPLRGRDRRILLARRVAQHCAGALFAACIGARREATQERITLWQLPAGGATAQWLHWLAALPNPAAGTVALPAVLAHGLAKLATQEPTHWLQGFWHTPAGLRHIVLQQNALILTRLLPVPQPTPELLAETMQQAAQTAQQYLARHGWRDGQSEQVIGIMPPALLAPLRGILPASVLLVPPAAMGAWLRCAWPTPEPHSLMAALGQHMPVPTFFLPAAAHQRRHRAWARWGWAATGALGLVSLYMFAQQGLLLQHARQQFRSATAAGAALQQTLTATRAGLSPQAASRSHWRHVRTVQAAKVAASPWPLLQALGTTLPPTLRLQELRWQAKDGADAPAATAMAVFNLLDLTGDKDSQQQIGLQRYQAYLKTLQAALPAATLRTVQAPFALGESQTFTDPAMLATTPPLAAPTARLELALP
jgi:hypothetical protein